MYFCDVLSEWNDERWSYDFFEEKIKYHGLDTRGLEKMLNADTSNEKNMEERYRVILDSNTISVEDFLFYIDNERKYNLIRNRLNCNGSLQVNNERIKELQEEIIRYFKKYKDKIFKDSKNYQLTRFNRSFNSWKFDYYHRLHTQTFPVEFKREGNTVVKKRLTGKEFENYKKELKYIQENSKVLIPCNIFYYLLVIDEIIDSFARAHNYAETRDNKEYKKPVTKYFKVTRF